jgi:hypothetical protein
MSRLSPVHQFGGSEEALSLVEQGHSAGKVVLVAN